MKCSDSLFDVAIDLDELNIKDGSLDFIVNLQEKFGVEEIDVHIKYSIIDSENEEIYSQIETKAVKGELISYRACSGVLFIRIKQINYIV